MTSTKLIIAALMVPVFTLTALVMAAAAVAHGLLAGTWRQRSARNAGIRK
jgi:hypothetical protein